MDLTRLYNLTTPELREEAERMGVGDTYAMSRGQLIHAIRNQAGERPQEGLLGKVLGFAKWALQAAKEEPLKEAVSVPESVPESESESVSVTASESGAESGNMTANGTANASEPDSGPPSRPPAGVFSRSAGIFEEPFPTRTMARILAEQGHFKRSLAIYAGLLRGAPADRELSAEAADVRVRSRARRSQVH
jgi:hypothetical protein